MPSLDQSLNGIQLGLNGYTCTEKEFRMTDIDRQIKENPLSYEDAKRQFIEQTQKLGIKHAFTFDEAWQIGIELRKKAAHREKLKSLSHA